MHVRVQLDAATSRAFALRWSHPWLHLAIASPHRLSRAECARTCACDDRCHLRAPIGNDENIPAPLLRSKFAGAGSRVPNRLDASRVLALLYSESLAADRGPVSWSDFRSTRIRSCVDRFPT